MRLQSRSITTITDEDGARFRARPFRPPLRLSDFDKILYRPPVHFFRRVDLMAQASYGSPLHKDMFLEFTETPYWEWAVDEEIIGISTKIANQL